MTLEKPRKLGEFFSYFVTIVLFFGKVKSV